MQTNSLKKIEYGFFILIIFLNALPVISNRFMPSLDGPAHLYNSNLINQLIFTDNEALKKYFTFNHEPVPNWTGHIILCFFNSVLPAFVAERLLLLFYVIGLPLSFRSLVKAISPENYFLSYIIFPFVYSYLFFLGFYNFYIAFVFMIFTLNYRIRVFEPEIILRTHIKERTRQS